MTDQERRLLEYTRDFARKCSTDWSMYENEAFELIDRELTATLDGLAFCTCGGKDPQWRSARVEDPAETRSDCPICNGARVPSDEWIAR